MGALRDLGEFGLIRRLTRGLAASDALLEGIGDDCAVLKTSGFPLLLSCDLSVENVHFRRATASPEDIGWKAAASALSDVAAMGGTPLACLIALACPEDTAPDFLDALYQGIATAVTAAGAVVAGGDTTRSIEGIVLDVTVLGEAREGRYLTRKGAQPGDVLAVAGPLGPSSAGLHALEYGLDAPALVEAHRRPSPHYAEGRWLCRRPEVHAMIDISDGLAQDAGHLGEASGLGIDIDPDALPIDERLAEYGRYAGVDPLDFILKGGEDYALAVAVAAAGFAQTAQAFVGTFGALLTAVGRFTDAWPDVRVGGAPCARLGFEHFQ